MNAASLACCCCAIHIEKAARPVVFSAGAPATMPSKSSGKRCAAFSPCRPPAEQPAKYERVDGRAVVRGDDRLAGHGHFVDGAVPEVDELLGILHPDAAAAFMSCIRAGRGITAAHAGRERVAIDRPVPAAIADRLELPVPPGRGQPDFNLDVGIARRFQRGPGPGRMRQDR